MCGIFGATGVKGKAALARAETALLALAHRGPDGGSHTLEDGVFVGHRRLSIIDLSARGTQPLSSDGIHLTVNGEIYNYRDLRADLRELQGAAFMSDSDSEVMLHGYRAWGLDALMDKADGMFVMALHDVPNRRVVLARDHAGIKPIYYAVVDGQLAWASELKALVAYFGEDRLSVDKTAIYDFLTYGYVPAPKSLYVEIRKLEPAHVLVFDLATGAVAEHKRYWELPLARDVRDVEEGVRLVREAIGAEVEAQLVADVPLGAFLSGGVDSSIVCHEAAKHTQQLVTCSIGFEDKSVDESAFALEVAEKLGTKHITRVVGAGYVAKHRRKLRTWFDEPFVDTSAFPTYEVSALARENMTVVLTGDGGDEVFGGYNHYREWRQALVPWLGLLFFLRWPVAWVKNHAPAPMAALARKVEPFCLLDPLERQVRWRGGLLPHDKAKRQWRKALDIPRGYDDCWFWRKFYRKDLPWARRAMVLDFYTSLPEDMLTKVDRTSMDVALEARVPLLGKRVLAAAGRLRENVLFCDGELKGVLKRAYADVLPHGCLYRRKQGFSIGAQAIREVFAPGRGTLGEAILRDLFADVLRRAGVKAA